MFNGVVEFARVIVCVLVGSLVLDSSLLSSLKLMFSRYKSKLDLIHSSSLLFSSGCGLDLYVLARWFGLILERLLNLDLDLGVDNI